MIAGRSPSSDDVSAQALVDRLIYMLRLNNRPLRDDVAIMVLRRAPA